MYNKSIWNSGDIITTEKWNNIKNNTSLINTYQLPVTCEWNVMNEELHITINKSYNEILNLIQNGVLCYYIENYNNQEEFYIDYIIGYNGLLIQTNYYDFHISAIDSNKMVNFDDSNLAL